MFNLKKIFFCDFNLNSFIFFLDDWFLDIHDIKNKSYLTKNKLIKPVNKNINFKLSSLVDKGWYLIGFQYFGGNSNIRGSILCNQRFFRQSRIMNPVRIRYRVLRIPLRSEISLNLENVQNNIFIKKLFFVRIFNFDALRRIKKRLINDELILKGSKFKFSYLWKKYNLLLSSKKNLITYSEWINNVEDHLIKEKLKCSIFVNNKFDKIYFDNLKSSNNENWVILFNSKNIILSASCIDILNIILFKNKTKEIFYGDEDFICEDGKRLNPIFKPAWNFELFISNPEYSFLWIIKGRLWNKIFYKLKDENNLNYYSILIEICYELKNDSLKIGHIPFILSHRNFSKNDDTNNLKQFKNSVYKHFLKTKVDAFESIKINNNKSGISINWAVPNYSLLSIIIPIKDKVFLLQDCIASILKFPPGCDIEIIVVNNNSKEKETFDFLENLKTNLKNKFNFVLLNISGEFNYSKINNIAANYCLGNSILLLNNDVSFKTNFWGKSLLSNSLRKGIGCVGIKLIYPDNTIQHAGVIMGYGGIAGHSHCGFSSNENGYDNRLSLNQEFSAVTAACLCISKENWNLLGGLDEYNLKVNYNDVDICLRAKNLGLSNIYLADVEAYHFESITRGRPIGKAYKQWRKEAKYINNKWNKIIINDHYYSPYLSLRERSWAISLRINELNVR